MSTAPSHKLMTADEFSARTAELGRCELIEGVVKKMSPAGADHGEIVNELSYHINVYVREHRWGKVYAAETGFRLGPDQSTVRAPDIAVIAKDRAEDANTSKFIPIPPDLAVEVNSPNDVIGEVVAKVQWWLAHGTKAVWVVDPRSKTVTAYHPDGSARVVHLNESLTGGEVLPGFDLPLTDLFPEAK